MSSFDSEDRLRAEVERLAGLVKHHERRLAHTLEELESLTSLLNHDLRSPLVSVMGFTAELGYLRDELLARWAKADPDNPQRERLEVDLTEAFGFLEQGALRMGRLLDVLSELAAHRRRPLAVEPLELAAVVELAAEPARASMPNGALHIGALPSVESDRRALLELLGPVLDNALRYRRASVPHRVEVTGISRGDRVELCITDNGRGIDRADLQRAFRPFVRLTPLDAPGEGIGLAHARAIARRLGGDLTAESDGTSGSTFRVDLPRQSLRA